MLHLFVYTWVVITVHSLHKLMYSKVQYNTTTMSYDEYTHTHTNTHKYLVLFGSMAVVYEGLKITERCYIVTTLVYNTNRLKQIIARDAITN